MIPLLIVLIVLFVLALILLLKVKVIIEYKEEVALTVCVYGIPFRILPRKRRRVRPMSAREAARLRERRRKEAEKKRLKAEKKQKEREEKKRRKKAQRERERSSLEARRKAREARRRKKAESATLEENLDLVKRLVSFFFSALLRHLRIDVTRIHIVIGTEEASKTAILYGITVQTVSYILTLLSSATNVRGLQKQDVYVDTDFLAEETRVDLKIAFSLRLWHVLHLALGALVRLIKNRVGVRRRVTLEEAARAAHTSAPAAQHKL